MLSTQGYAAVIAKAALQPFVFERQDVGPHDVLIASSPSPIAASVILIFIKSVTNGAIRFFPWCPATKLLARSRR
jgi:hypothetical protein